MKISKRDGKPTRKIITAMVVSTPVLAAICGERWRWVRRYKGLYKVSTYGRVKNWKGRLMVGGKRNGYHFVNLTKNRKETKFYVHRLVLEAFVGPCPEGMECRHFPDRSKTNNNLDNLSWATTKRNQRDRAIHGTSNRGERCGTCRLSRAEIKKIRWLLSTGNWSQQEIADMFLTGQGYVSQIKNKKNRRWG